MRKKLFELADHLDLTEVAYRLICEIRYIAEFGSNDQVEELVKALTVFK